MRSLIGRMTISAPAYPTMSPTPRRKLCTRNPFRLRSFETASISLEDVPIVLLSRPAGVPAPGRVVRTGLSKIDPASSQISLSSTREADYARRAGLLFANWKRAYDSRTFRKIVQGRPRSRPSVSRDLGRARSFRRVKGSCYERPARLQRSSAGPWGGLRDAGRVPFRFPAQDVGAGGFKDRVQPPDNRHLVRMNVAVWCGLDMGKHVHRRCSR